MDSEAPESNIGSNGPPRPTLLKLFKVFLLAGGLSFGGGAVAYLREYLVNREAWLDDEGFLGAMEISETLPGLNAVNMSIIVGDNLRGVPGAIAAVIGMLLPGSIVVMLLGILWESNHANPEGRRLLIGIAAAATGLLAAVTLQLGRKQFRTPPDLAIVIVTFAAVSFFKFSLPTVLLTIGSLGIWLYRPGAAPARGPRERPPFARNRFHFRFRR
ncbi:MAG: chromate transporter [Candidatus Binataceae bacterium]